MTDAIVSDLPLIVPIGYQIIASGTEVRDVANREWLINLPAVHPILLFYAAGSFWREGSFHPLKFYRDQRLSWCFLVDNPTAGGLYFVRRERLDLGAESFEVTCYAKNEGCAAYFMMYSDLAKQIIERWFA